MHFSSEFAVNGIPFSFFFQHQRFLIGHRSRKGGGNVFVAFDSTFYSDMESCKNVVFSFTFELLSSDYLVYLFKSLRADFIFLVLIFDF